MRLRDGVNILLGRRLERSKVLLAAPDDLPASMHGTAWLVQLRWVAVVGQLLTITVARFGLGVDLPIAALLTVVAVTAISNLMLAIWTATLPIAEGGSQDDHDVRTVPILGLVQLLDLILLTILLALSGGPTNPFLVFYFVNLCLGAVVLPRAWAWVLSVVAIICFFVMSTEYLPLHDVWLPGNIAPIRLDEGLTRAQWGLLVAFATCDVVIVYFTSLLRDQLRRRGHELRAMQEEAARAHKLEALGTLAAGAAHELANPMGTIAVVAREVQRRLAGTETEPRVVEDIALIRSELDTCRSILKRMSADAGQAMGEELVEAPVRELLEESLEGLRDADRVDITVAPNVEDRSLEIPLVGLSQAIRGIVQNALAASARVQRVRLAAVSADGHVRVTVRDEGVGMHRAVLARVGDPFFTTKEPGSGTGLGVFLARAMIERLGGRLTIDSASGRGTTVTIVLPAGGE